MDKRRDCEGRSEQIAARVRKRISANLLPRPLHQDALTLWRGLGLIRSAAPRHFKATIILTLIESLLPAASVWLLKHIIDTVAAATRAPMPAGAQTIALSLAGCYLLLVCIQQTVRAVSRYVEAQLDDQINGALRLRVMQKVSVYPDLSPFESPPFHDRLELLQREIAYRPMNLKDGLAMVIQAVITLGCMLLFLARLHPALAFVLVLTAGPALLCQRQLQGNAWYRLAETAPVRRRLAYFARVLLTAPFAKEVRLFGCSGHMLVQYQSHFEQMMTIVDRTRWGMVRVSLALSLPAAVGVGGAFAYVIGQALRGILTLGDLTLYTGALLQANTAASSLVKAVGRLHEALPFMRELLAFLDSTPTMSVPASGHRVSDAPVADQKSPGYQGFRLDQVAFRYPDTDRQVFAELSLDIPWGRCTAIVGENGAGKSTLVKLLTRLHDPTGGRILLNGVDLKDHDIEDLRSQIAVVFQDFARYQLPLWENIALGDVRRLNDRRRIVEAARNAGAEELIRRLPQKEETLLGREFEGGAELSGGEWQKIALARAFMRDAPILILDEPTAALDARSEYEIYRRFIELAAGRTTLLISHRFSTVRMADRIVVLEHGQVIEEGDHRDLVARRGRYAELYAMQAERYET